MLIAVSDPHRGIEEVADLKALASQGLTYIHVRKPDFSPEALREYVQTFPESLYPQLVLHSYYELARELSLGGIHLTERFRGHCTTTKTRLREFQAAGIRLSASMHSLHDLAQSQNYSYVFFSPVFQSISKPGRTPTIAFEEIVTALSRVRGKVLALGGVAASNIDQVFAAGFSGAALCGSLWQAQNPVAVFSDIQRRWRGQ